MILRKIIQRASSKKKSNVLDPDFIDKLDIQGELDKLRTQIADSSYDNRNIKLTHFLKKTPGGNAKKIDFSHLNCLRIQDESQWDKIPRLTHNLDQIVEQPGIYKIEDLKGSMPKPSFDFLKNIPQPHEMDFSQIPDYSPPSYDVNLREFARFSKSKYLMSTSTISSIISQVYYLFSVFQEADYEELPSYGKADMRRYMNAQRKPSSSFLRCVDKENDIYALDSDSGVFPPYHKILMDMGNILEKVYTMEPEHFEGVFIKGKQDLSKYSLVEEDYHRFLKINDDLCLRSQIDCQSTLPNGEKIVYEIKTRATAPQRYEVTRYKDFMDYKVDPIIGFMNSFEREYYDLIRGAFMKYFFQLKIGGMDGALIGFHNTVSNFGFEYVKRSTIEKLIFGNAFKADVVFMVCSKIVTTILDEILVTLKGKDYEFLKISYGAYSSEMKLTFAVELFTDEDYDLYKKKMIPHTEEIFEVTQYYQKYRPNCTVYKYDIRLFPKLNGIYNLTAFQDITEEDKLELEYTFEDCGIMDKSDYLQLLLNSYKTLYGTLEMRYGANWFMTELEYKF